MKILANPKKSTLSDVSKFLHLKNPKKYIFANVAKEVAPE